MTLANLLNQSGALSDDVQVRELSEAEANKLLAPTKERASRFFRTLPCPGLRRPGQQVGLLASEESDPSAAGTGRQQTAPTRSRCTG